MRQHSEQTNIVNFESEFSQPGVVDNHIDNAHIGPSIDSNGDPSGNDQSKVGDPGHLLLVQIRGLQRISDIDNRLDNPNISRIEVPPQK
jgi:hypothetical protein